MKRISSLVAIVAILGLGVLLTLTHSESVGQTQSPQKGDADAKDALKRLDVLKAEHDQKVKELKHQIKILEAERKEQNGSLEQAMLEIEVLKRLSQVATMPDQRAKIIAELAAKLESLDRKVHDLFPVINPLEEKKEYSEAAQKRLISDLKNTLVGQRWRYFPIQMERKATMNVLLAALAAGPAPQPNFSIMGMLKGVIDTKGLQEKVKLKTALEYLSDRFAGLLPIFVDMQAFNPDNDPKGLDPYEEEVVLPPVPSRMPLNIALRLLLSQVGKGDATYQIRQGHLEITTLKNATAANALPNSLVTCSFDLRPLHEVLETLTAETGLDINLDPNVGKKSAALVKATFRNTTLEEALVTATEMAELKYVVLDRTVYVTTPEKAIIMRKEQKERDERREKNRPANPGPQKRVEPPA